MRCHPRRPRVVTRGAVISELLPWTQRPWVGVRHVLCAQTSLQSGWGRRAAKEGDVRSTEKAPLKDPQGSFRQRDLD